MDTLAVAIRWIDCIHSHKGAKFFLYDWPLDETKEAVIIRFLRRFCRTKQLSPPYNIVAFLDFASDHAKSRIQNTVRATGQIARCYHLHSHGNDGLQCCDLLLGATSAISANPLLRFEYAALKEM